MCTVEEESLKEILIDTFASLAFLVSPDVTQYFSLLKYLQTVCINHAVCLWRFLEVSLGYVMHHLVMSKFDEVEMFFIHLL